MAVLEKSSVSSITTKLTDDILSKIERVESTLSRTQRISMLVFGRDGIKVVWLVEGQRSTIGRMDPSDVTIRDRSLSREHAVIEYLDDGVWIEDLSSTNGTRINGDRITRAKVKPGDEIAFGSVISQISSSDTPPESSSTIQNHAQFISTLAAEIVRAREFHRSLALVMCKTTDPSSAALSKLFNLLNTKLKAYQHIALYGTDIIEILLPEAQIETARTILDSVVQVDRTAYFSIGMYPAHANSGEELIDLTRTALRTRKNNQKTRLFTVQRDPITVGQDGYEFDTEKPVVKSPVMRALYSTTKRLASSHIPVLITGETGTGKEVVARSIHGGGKSGNGRIVAVNCGAIPAQLIESTLFGHEKGAFTGATTSVKGVFESANKGTVFLDEIGELPAAAQASLLRVLETKTFCRVGSTKEISVDVRVIAATHQDLEVMCKEGKFREDLFYRLNAMTLHVPPLRERPEEIELFAYFFLKEATLDSDHQISKIERNALDLLMRYTWPGNIRELRNVIARAVVITENGQIVTEDLPEKIQTIEPAVVRENDYEAAAVETEAPVENRKDCDLNLKSKLKEYEAQLLSEALKSTDGDRTRAAKSLGLPIRTLNHKLQLYNIKIEEKRDR